ncbi:hypothetical protein [Streptomyces sp. LNU-CPARS28]|uniref:hypothetical protein n=1 Tax=Streptomyces sp. LNU-CPARS28 TaxID=3137371 RepID=UPI00313668A2
MTEGATWHADQLYRAHLHHLRDCPACGRDDARPEGTRLRQAVRAARLAADVRTQG